MFTRAGRAAIFDRRAFNEAFFDDDAAADGAIVVATVGALTYLGSLAWLGRLDVLSVGGFLESLITSVVSWLILALATWFVASRLFHGGGRPQTMMALHGLAALPLILEVFGGLIAGAGLVWYLAALVMATREASDLNLRDAGVSVLIGFAVAAIFRALLGVPFAVFSAIF
jgi:hypothetical protein